MELNGSQTKINDFRHPETGNIVSVAGMIHIGEAEYYKTVRREVRERSSNGIVHFEGVSAGDATELANASYLERKKYYMVSKYLLGITKLISSSVPRIETQKKFLQPESNWENHDTDLLTISKELDMRFLTAMRVGHFILQSILEETPSYLSKRSENTLSGKMHGFAGDFLEDARDGFRGILLEELDEYEGSDKQELLKLSMGELFLESTKREKKNRSWNDTKKNERDDVGFIMKQIFKNTDKSMKKAEVVIVNNRDNIAIEALTAALLEQPERPVVLVWGQGHMPGISKGIEALGFKQSDRQVLTAF